MKIFKTIFIVTFIALLGFFYFFSKLKSEKPEQFVRKREGIVRLLKNAQEVSRIWQEGEDSREWRLVKNSCLKKYGITESFDESLMRCHPILLECVNQFLTKQSFKIINRRFEYPSYVFSLQDSESKETLDVALADDCHELYLEPNTYAYGEAPAGKESEDYLFEIFNRQIYFDRHLVTNSEVNEWIKNDPSQATDGLKTEDKGNNLFLPATHLNYKQMQNFCSFKGKELMLAHVFDAASFITSDRHRSPYYWTKKRVDQKITCENIFTKECLVDKKWKLNSAQPSWSGLYDSMGGPLEVVRNPIDPESNLKVSSFYFPRESTWHRLGFRAQWDGLGHALSNFNFKGMNPAEMENFYQVSFRCMREVSL